MNQIILKFALPFLLLFGFTVASAQHTVSIGSEVLNEKAVLTLVTATGDQGFILPVVQDRNAISPAASEKGMLVYENASSNVYLWNGSSWLDITAAGSSGAVASLNDIADVNAAAPTAGQVLKFLPGSGWVAADVSLTDSDDQGLILTGDQLTIEGGTGTIDLSVYRQDISFNTATNELTISEGSTITLPSGGTDADADPTNEIQDISLVGTEISISDGSTIDLAPLIPPGGTDDQTAEEVSYDNTTTGLTAIEVQGAIDELASSGTVNTDNQELTYNSADHTLAIDRGNTVDLSGLAGGGAADDWGAQVVQRDNSLKGDGTAGSPIGLAQQTAASGQVLKWDGTNWTPANDNVTSGSAGAVNTSARLIGDGTAASPLDIAPQGADPGQVLKWDGSSWKPENDNEGAGGGATYTAGDGISIDGSNVISNSGDADSDLTNEIQNLTLSGSIINISDGTGVDIGPLIPAGGTDDQTAAEVSFSNTTSGLTAGDVQAAIDELVASGMVDTDDQTLKYEAETYRLGIQDGNTIDLSNLASLWNETPTGDGISCNPGFVGIETNSPTAKLDVNGDIRTRALSGTGERNVVADADGNLVIGVGSIGSSLWTETLDDIYYNDGNVGIGTAAPAVELGAGRYLTLSPGGATTSNQFPSLELQGHSSTIGSTIGRIDFIANSGVGNSAIARIVARQANGGQFNGDISFYTKEGSTFSTSSLQESMTIKYNGNVGIGTATPAVESGAGRYLTLSPGGATTSNQFPSLELQGHSGTSEPTIGRIDFISNSSPGNAAIARIEARKTNSRQFNGDISFYTRDGATFPTSSLQESMTIKYNGNVGIGTESPTAKFHINQGGQDVGLGLRFTDNFNADWDITHGYSLRFHYGGVIKGYILPTTGAYVVSSDKKLKAQIDKIGSVMDRVRLLRPSSYFYKSDKNQTNTMGFIAQEVLQVFPELVHYSEADNLYGVDYSGFGVIAIKAIQEQQEIIETQQKAINDLETRLEKLEQLINR